MATDLDIDTRAAQPKKFQGDNGMAEQHSIADIILAENREAAKVAVAITAHRGLRFSKIKPPGAD